MYDVSSLFVGGIGHLWWVYLILFASALIPLILQHPRIKGQRGEAFVNRYLTKRLNASQYHLFHDLIIASDDGTTQIDHIIISEFGIFVIETKNMQGWIFGETKQATWTQNIYGRRYRFQNPLRQNYKHIKALERLLAVPPVTLYSFVVFVGDSHFKTAMPAQVGYVDDLLTFIHNKKLSVIAKATLPALIAKLETTQRANTRQTRRAHVAGLKAKHAGDASPVCPRCHSAMVLRTARKGKRAGETFWGCRNYPRCRYTRAHTH